MGHAKGNVGDSAQDTASQEEWLRAYFKREGDYYFMIETACGIPVGTYGIYNVKGNHGESGRWIVRPEVPAAIPSIRLGLEAAFERLELSKLIAHTVSTNHCVLSLNRKLGFQKTAKQPISQLIEGKPKDLVQFELKAEDWPRVRMTIEPAARVSEESIRAWEQSFAQRA